MSDLEHIRSIVEDVVGFDLVEDTRNRNVVKGRHYFFYLCRKHTSKTFRDIGFYLGKDHATAIHGNNKISNEIDFYEDVKIDIDTMESKIDINKLKFKTYKDEVCYLDTQIKYLRKRKRLLNELLKQP